MAFWPLVEKAKRHDRLIDVIKSVKMNKDTKLNNRLDWIMDLEIDNVPKVKDYASDEDPRITPVIGKEREKAVHEFLNSSWPGTCVYHNEDNKRLELVEWAEEQVRLDEEEENR